MTKTTRYTCTLLSALLLGSALASGASAADNAATRWKAGDWLVRGRAIMVAPDEGSTITPASLGGNAQLDNAVVPEVDFTYFFTDNIAAELILATSRHTATAKNTSSGSIDAGNLWVLPPTLTLQYHFTNFEKAKPYVGAGINYTMYYNEKGGAATNVKYEDSFGYALQAGVDVPIDERWSWNFDVKKIFVSADAKWADGTIQGDVELDPWVVGTGIGYKF